MSDTDLGYKFTEDAEIDTIIDAKWERLSHRLNGERMPLWAEMMYKSLMQEMVRLERHWGVQRKYDKLYLAVAGVGGVGGAITAVVSVLT